MKKYIFSENQIKKVVDKVVNEQLTLTEQHRDILKIPDVAEIISRTGNDYDVVLSVLQDAFREGGDTAVNELFKSATDMNLEVISTGRYVIKY